jgi:Na+-translocating ferredoxin:NAD+ oxidoreductase subunit B
MQAWLVLTVVATSLLALGLLLDRWGRGQVQDDDLLARAIDSVLPQTQCQECGYHGCLPYARAISGQSEAIDKCAPGGAETARRIAVLLNRDPPWRVASKAKPPSVVARIEEAACIGCTLCIQACPVDAIVGAAKQMHTVLEVYCTGCALCVAPCPVDCITMEAPQSTTRAQWLTQETRIAA